MLEVSLLLSFLWLGAIGFGGGYAILSIIYDTIEPLKIISVKGFHDLIAISQITPGPVAINVATYVGYIENGWIGAILLSLALCIPGMSMTYAMSVLLRKGKELDVVKNVLDKLRIAGIVLLITSAVFIANGTLVHIDDIRNVLNQPIAEYVDFMQIGIFVVSLITCIKSKINPIALLVIMGVASLLVGNLIKIY